LHNARFYCAFTDILLLERVLKLESESQAGATGFASALRTPCKSFEDRSSLDQLAQSWAAGQIRSIASIDEMRKALAEPVAPDFRVKCARATRRLGYITNARLH
jgi:hypothetical protein